MVPLKFENGITSTNAFQKILNEPGRKPNKMRLDKERKFCNRSVKPWLQDNDIEFIKHIMKENILSLKDLLKPFRTKSINI